MLAATQQADESAAAVGDRVIVDTVWVNATKWEPLGTVFQTRSSSG